MARMWTKTKPPGAGPTATLHAAAATVSAATWQRLRTSGSTTWQAESWEFYDCVPEYRFVTDWLAAQASRAFLFVTEIDDSGRPVLDNATVARSATFLGGPVMQTPLIHDAVLQLLIPGECYIYAQLVDGGEIWDVASVDEVTVMNGTVTVDHGNGDAFTLDPQTSLVIKVWDPHPRRRSEATSPSRAVRVPMREIVRCDQTVTAQIDSRLATAGILLLPKEMSFSIASGEDADGPGDDSGADKFMTALTEAMMTAIADRDSVAAIVPIVVRAPAEMLDKPRLLALSTPVSETILDLRDRAIKRLAMGLDISPEQLTGVGASNHLSSWQMQESLVTTQIIPLLELVCAAFTEQYLWPALQTQAVEDFRKFVVWYDISALIQRPDRASDAQAVFDRNELSGTALRRANGFTEDDAPTPAEKIQNALLEVAGKVPTAAPAIINQLLAAFDLAPDSPGGVSIAPAQGQSSQARGIDRSAPARDRALPPTDTRAAPALPAAGSLLAAAEALTLQALETAGKRLVGRARYKLDPLPPYAYHTAAGYACTPTSAARLLDGTFESVGQVADGLAVDADLLHEVLHTYAAGLLCAGAVHSRAALAAVLDRPEFASGKVPTHA